MRRNHHDLVGVQINYSVVELLLAIAVIGVFFALHPRQHPPFRRRQMVLLPAPDRIGRLRALRNEVAWLWSIERQRAVLLVLRSPLAERVLVVADHLQPRVDD